MFAVVLKNVYSVCVCTYVCMRVCACVCECVCLCMNRKEEQFNSRLIPMLSLGWNNNWYILQKLSRHSLQLLL